MTVYHSATVIARSAATRQSIGSCKESRHPAAGEAQTAGSISYRIPNVLDGHTAEIYSFLKGETPFNPPFPTAIFVSLNLMICSRSVTRGVHAPRDLIFRPEKSPASSFGSAGKSQAGVTKTRRVLKNKYLSPDKL